MPIKRRFRKLRHRSRWRRIKCYEIFTWPPRLLTSRMAYDGRVMAAWLLMGFGISIAGPLYAQITGRVVVNGGPPLDHVYVTVHCEGSARLRWDWAGYTDKRGEF